jgi:MFS transporter, DHA1 family, multidrug resistance protein
VTVNDSAKAGATAPRAGEASVPPTPWGTVILLGALTAFAPLSLDLYLPSLPTIGRSLGAGSAGTQATVASFILGMAVGQLFYGPASDRLGRKPAVLAGVLIYVVASAVCALSDSIEVLIAARFVEALGGCAGAVVARAMVRDRFGPTETAQMLSLMMLIMGVAPVLAPVAGGYVLTAWGWRACFWILTAFGVTMAAAVVLRMKESRSAATLAQARSEHPLRAYLAVLGRRKILGYSLCSALNGAMFFTYLSCAAELIIEQYGVSPAHFGWVFGANAAALIGASQVNRHLLRRMTADQVLVRAGLAATILAGLMATATVVGLDGPWVVLPLLFVLLGSYGFLQGNTMAGALNADPSRAGTISALLGAAGFAAGALAASVTAAFSDGTPRPMAITMFVAQLGSMSALRWLALRPQR